MQTIHGEYDLPIYIFFSSFLVFFDVILTTKNDRKVEQSSNPELFSSPRERINFQKMFALL